MAKQDPLSRAELEVARELWKLKQASVREVFESLAERRETDFWTVQTLLRRLEKKEYVKSRLEGRVRIYQPRAKPQTVVNRLTEDFLDRVFDGEAMPLVQHLIQNKGLSESEIAALRKLLDEKEN